MPFYSCSARCLSCYSLLPRGSASDQSLESAVISRDNCRFPGFFVNILDPAPVAVSPSNLLSRLVSSLLLLTRCFSTVRPPEGLRELHHPRRRGQREVEVDPGRRDQTRMLRLDGTATVEEGRRASCFCW